LSAPTPWGAEVTVVDGARTHRVPLASGGNTHSQSEAAITVELTGDHASAVTIHWPSGLTQMLTNVPSGSLTVDEPVALDLPRRATVGTPLAGTLTFADGLDDPTQLQVTASDGAAVTVERAGPGQLRFTHPGLASAGLLTLSVTLSGTPLSVHPRIIFTV
jgi:hypothetical protein